MTSGMLQNIMEQPAALKTASESLLGTDFKFLRKKITGAHRLYLVGTGASLNACYAAKSAFVKYSGILPFVIPAAQIGSCLPVLSEDSFMIVVSQSGDSFETRQLCETMRAHGIKFCGLTNSANSALATMSDVPVYMNVGGEVSSATKTHTASMLLFYLLSDPKGGKEWLSPMLEAVEKAVTEMPNEIGRLADNLYKASPAFALGDNINYSSARQAALLMKEKNQLCVEGMTVSEFRHGAVEVTENGMQLLLLSTEAAFYDEFQKHTDFLKSIGAQLNLISSKAFPGIPSERTVLIDSRVPDCFSPLVVTIPLQLLAERAAVINGFDVDGFRYLSKVVAKY